jgi:ketosteroid isomerase-like protein
MTLEGKGFFTWKIPNCERGDANMIAARAKAAGLTHLVVKVADGTVIYNGTWGNPTDYTTPVVNALRTHGINVWGWHYLYGDNPSNGANVAIARIRQYNLDGYVLDVEKEYKADGKRAAAKTFMTQIRSACPNLTIALSSYRYPSLHPQIPWTVFLENCDLNMPQVYWLKAHNAGDQLARCVAEFQAKKPSLPVIPTGAAFREFGWKPEDTEVQEFLNKAKELNLSAVNFWEWSDARSGNLPGVWEVIQNYRWSERDDHKDICVGLVDAFNSHDIEKIMSYYTLPAVHINAIRTTQGLDSLRSWYTQLFNEILPKSRFKLGSYSGKGDARHFTWTATSAKGNVHDGNDTLGISHGKINYHYSFFTVTP